ncbi:DUF4391 domain-containing protein [Paremcibacter congregatus]|uniref:DUF4391 domain-containing protein n=1 Tax=Paremcibacter congregatus TaxID=2043170 RepID=UPI0030EBF4B8|tara:strand:- start:16091 stop:16762 length:672 start_codon:yes stop_codon:yes gene_type:complete
MSAFFDYPKAAKFGRILPKSKIYDHAHASSKLQQLFVDQVGKIIWQYKLAPETINLAATKFVSEIQVFEIRLRTAACDEDILRAIDKAIPFPIIFELSHKDKCKVVAAYKRANEVVSTKWVLSEYFETDWQTTDRPRTALPTALNLSALYDKILGNLLPHDIGMDKPLAARIENLEAIRAGEREIARIKARMTREKQYNKRIAINAELRAAEQQFNQLTGQKN